MKQESMKLYAVVGNPISHSLSPNMHNAGLEELGIDAKYVRIAANNADEAIALAKDLGILGLNITAPFKEEMAQKCDTLNQEAKLLGAVNTIKIENGKLHGFNTDVLGVTKALEANGVKINGNKFVVIGAGGAAKAAALGLLSEGAQVVIANRTIEKAKDIANRLGCDYCSLSSSDLTQALVNAVAIVSTANTLDQLIPKELLSKELVVLDAIIPKRQHS